MPCENAMNICVHMWMHPELGNNSNLFLFAGCSSLKAEIEMLHKFSLVFWCTVLLESVQFY